MCLSVCECFLFLSNALMVSQCKILPGRDIEVFRSFTYEIILVYYSLCLIFVVSSIIYISYVNAVLPDLSN